jgi:hypothetical protein
MKNVLTALVVLLVISQSAHSQTRENFTVGGQSAFVITANTPAPGNPWIAYAPAVGGLPDWPSGFDAWMIDQYLGAGIAVAGVYAGDLSGSPAQRLGYTNLYNELVNNRGYAARCVFHARSRGGLLSYNWAADNPGKVAAIGGVFPVTNLLSYPGAGTAAAHYGISVTELTTNDHLYNPIERLLPLFNSGVKIFHIHGDSDGTVPLNLNSQITKDRYDALGGEMTLKVIPGGGHDYSLHWQTDPDLTAFVIAEALAAANTPGPPTLETLTSVVPADDSVDVATFSNLVATFSESIALTGSGSITLKNLSPGGADIPIALPGDVSIAGAVLTINPATDLVGEEEYAVEISSDAIEDLDAITNAYAGLLSTDTPNWSFTTAAPETTDSTVSTLDPADGTIGVPSIDVPVGANLVATFDEDIAIGTGNITIMDLDTPSQIAIPVGDGQVSISGTALTIDPSTPLSPGTNYAIQIDATAIDDLAGNSFAGISDNTTWNFTTQAQAPVVLANPSFEDDDVADSSHISSATGWTVAGAAGVHDFVASWTPQPTVGDQNGWVNGGGSLSQVTSHTITAGTVYTLTVDVGEYVGFSGSLATIRLFGSTSGLGTALSNINGTAELTGIDPANGFYTTDVTVTYTALPSDDPFEGQSLGIALIGESGTQVLFDNVRLDIPPTSSTFAGWISGYDVGGLTDWNDDPDGDNLFNGLEAWFGTHPGEFNAGLADLTTTGSVTTFTHPQNATPPSDLTGYYEWSPNLTNWYASGNGPGGGVTVTFSSDTTNTTTTVTATVSGAPDRVFMRAGVRQE